MKDGLEVTGSSKLHVIIYGVARVTPHGPSAVVKFALRLLLFSAMTVR